MSTKVVVRRGARRPRRRPRRRSCLARLIMPLCLIALMAVGGYYILNFPKDVVNTYPLKYENIIDQYAREYGLDPARVAAVIYCESSFVADAVSSAGARGLMQIMPETGAWIAQKLDEADAYTDERLFDPETNIRYGCWYLNYLNGRFDGDITKVTAAYHAGGGSVDKWLKDAENSSDGVTLESIPSEVTGRYVRHVKNAYEKYKELYADDAQT